MWFYSRALVLVGVLLIAACGFRPLYQKSADNPGVVEDFAQVKILNVRTQNRRNARLGQKMHSILTDRLNPEGLARRPQYRLEVDIRVSKARTGVQITDEATRARLTVSATFRLLNSTGKEVLTTGTERSENSYNVVESEFATLSAENDAADRAVRQISDAIKLRLGIYFQRVRATA